MIEPEKQDHWSDLAEELGLQPAPMEASSISASSEVREPAAAKHGATTEPEAPVKPLPSFGEGEEGESPQRGRRRRSAASAEVTTQEPSEVMPPNESAEVAETPAGEDRPRRRRRTRGNKNSRKATPGGTAETTAETHEEAEDDRPRRRRRRRGKKADIESEAPAVEIIEEKREQPPVEEPILDEEGDGDTEDFSTWNVPSWAEIIAGLYRPDH